MKTKLFQEPIATQLASFRDKARKKRRIAYDCMNAIVVGEYVLCKRGHEFKPLSVPGKHTPKGAVSLFSVLRGRTPRVCQGCKDYDPDLEG